MNARVEKMPLIQVVVSNRPKESRKILRRLAFPAAGLVGILLSGCVVQGQPSVLDPKGPASIPVTNFSWWMFGIAAVVLVIVTILLLIAVFRRRPGDLKTDQALPGDRRALTWVIVGGAVAPAVV